MHGQFTQAPLALPIPVGTSCTRCGRLLTPVQIRHRRKARAGSAPFCSQDCKKRWSQEHSTKISKTCLQCGDTYSRYPSDERKAEQRGYIGSYCSQRCLADAKRQGEARACTCEVCRKTFVIQPSGIRAGAKQGIVAGRFCSLACSRRVLGQEKSQRNRVDTQCAACGKPMRIIAARAKARKNVFCSMTCMGTMVPTWTRHGCGTGGIREDIGHYVRSRWEANVARILTAMGLAYTYEPHAFNTSAGAYTPDFHVPAWNAYVEVKGYMRPNAAAKLAAMVTEHPTAHIVMIEGALYRTLRKEWLPRLPLWEDRDL